MKNAEMQVLRICEFSILQSGDIHSGWMDDVLLTGSSYNPYKESADKGNKRRAERQKKGKQIGLLVVTENGIVRVAEINLCFPGLLKNKRCIQYLHCYFSLV